jgi:hypothetical protein
LPKSVAVISTSLLYHKHLFVPCIIHRFRGVFTILAAYGEDRGK